VRLLRSDSRHFLRPRPPKPEEISTAALAFSRDGTKLAAADSVGAVRVWDAASREQIARLSARRSDSFDWVQLGFDRAGARIVVTTPDGIVRVMNAADGTVAARMHLPGVVAAGFVGDGDTLITIGRSGEVRYWDWSRGKPSGRPLRPLTEVVTAASFSPDGRTVAFETGRGLWVWDRLAKVPAAQLPRSVNVYGPVFSPDGRTLAAINGQLWDVRSGTLLGSRLVGDATTVAFSPDGRVLASGGEQVRLWKGILWQGQADLRSLVCALVPVGLSKAEWARIAPGLAYRTTCRRG
jgi:WD40 repeat protein